ncbi:MAG: hypothetical protein AAGI90_00075 [Chlamydiota bacterium]
MATVSFEGFSQKLNKWDIYPGVSTVYSGPVRILVAIAQVVSGVALGIFSCAFGWTNGASSWGKNVSANAQETWCGACNLVRGVVATVPVLGNLLIYLYENSPLGPTVLRRDASGLYTLPPVDVPGFKNMGTITGEELNIRIGDFHIDTKNGIVPQGWILIE